MVQLLILLDYRSHLYSAIRARGASMEVEEIKTGFEELGYSVLIQHYSDINFSDSDFRGTFVLYQSSEDPSLLYKEYIEDVLLGLQAQGAILIPGFEKFRAHHNKVFMEILRKTIPVSGAEFFSQCFGTYEDYQRSFKPPWYPIVFKLSSGSKSQNVLLARNKNEADACARKLSATPSLYNLWMTIYNWFDRKGFTPRSDHRRKFVVQQYVPNLSGDYKIVIYGEKYFVLFRENRENDFRASGSGRLSFPKEVPLGVLDFAHQTFFAFDVPYASLDIGFDGKNCYLFEFQFVMFGQYAVERSGWFFTKNKNGWARRDEKTSAENELVSAVHQDIQRKGGVA